MTDATELDLDGKVLLPSRLNGRDSLRIRQVLSRTPYAAGLSVLAGSRGPMEVDDLVNALEALAERLKDAAEGASCNESELYDLKRDVAAFRRIIGTN